MATILYAEIYLICIIITGLLLFWQIRNGANSASERWLRLLLICMEVNFASNFIYTLIMGFLPMPSLRLYLGYAFKTLYHISLGAGVYTWCGYANIQNRGRLFSNPKLKYAALVFLMIPVVMAISNLWHHQLFLITEAGEYKRGTLF